MKKKEEVIKQDKFLEISWELKDVLYLLTPLVALLALVYTIKSNRVGRLNRLEDQFLNEIDNFWFKEFITPKILNPIFDFISQQHLKFKSLSPLCEEAEQDIITIIEKSIEQLTDATTELQLSLNLLSNIPYGETYSKSVTEVIDELEDHLSCFLFSAEELPFVADDSNTLQSFSSIQDIFSFTQSKVLELTKDYRNDTKVRMKDYALESQKSFLARFTNAIKNRYG